MIDPPVAVGRRAHLDRGGRRRSASSSSLHLATHGYDRAVMLIPTWLLLVVWVAAAGFTVTGQLVDRPRAAGADRRPRADRDADRLHRDAARLRRRRARAGPRSATPSAGRWRSSGAGDIVFDWDVAARPHLRRPRGRAAARPASAARSKARPRDWLDLIHPFDRDRYRATLDAVIEQRRGRIVAGFPPALGERALPLVPPQGAAGDRLRRRGHPHRRHARRRHREQDRRGAPAARRRARQPHRPAEPRALPRPARRGARPRSAATTASGRPSSSSTSTASSRSTTRSASRSAIRSCSRSSRRLGAAAASRRTRSRASPATSSPSSCSPSASPSAIVAFADMVRRAVATPITFAEREIFLTASIGIALHDAERRSARGDV